MNVFYNTGNKFYLLQIILANPVCDTTNDLIFRLNLNENRESIRIFHDSSQLGEPSETHFFVFSDLEKLIDSNYFYSSHSEKREIIIKSFLKSSLRKMKLGFINGLFHIRFKEVQIFVNPEEKEQFFIYMDYSNVKHIKNPTSQDYSTDLGLLYDNLNEKINSDSNHIPSDELKSFINDFSKLVVQPTDINSIDLLLSHPYLEF